MSFLHWQEHVRAGGHEIRAQTISHVCVCGMAGTDRNGRCDACADRALDLAYEATREPQEPE